MVGMHGLFSCRCPQCDYAVYEEFAADVYLMCDNACTYNAEGSPVHTAALAMRQKMDELYAKAEENLPKHLMTHQGAADAIALQRIKSQQQRVLPGQPAVPVLDFLVHGAMILSEPNLVCLLLRTLFRELRRLVTVDVKSVNAPSANVVLPSVSPRWS
jgi:hypothetical protein